MWRVADLLRTCMTMGGGFGIRRLNNLEDVLCSNNQHVSGVEFDCGPNGARKTNTLQGCSFARIAFY